jgi:hypothetical protein
VVRKDLYAGDHPSPAAGTKPQAVNSAGGSTKVGTPGALSFLSERAAPPPDPMKLALNQIEGERIAARSAAAITEAATAHFLDTLKSLQGVTRDYEPVLDPAPSGKLSDDYKTLDGIKTNLLKHTSIANQAAKNALNKAKDFNEDYLKKNCAGKNPLECLQGNAQFNEVLEQRAITQATVSYALVAEKFASATLARFKKYKPDPPIDSLLHSVQFTVTYGVNASPGWTLLQWKGPSPASGSAAAYTGQRTHLLNIALGPAHSHEQERLINNLLTFNRQ